MTDHEAGFGADRDHAGRTDERTDDPATEELLALVDRLGVLLEDNQLAELEVDADGTRVLLRRTGATPSAIEFTAMDTLPAAAPATSPGQGPDADTAAAIAPESAEPAIVPVISPLTGIFYLAPTPGSAPYVLAGGEVAVGQVIGLVEAMKLFNEIKSNVAGRVVRIVAESGALVKAKQALIEVEPL